MRRAGYYIILLLLLLSCTTVIAQQRNNLLAAKGKLILLIDLNSSKNDIDSILKRAGITGVNAPEIAAGEFSVLEKDGWKVVAKDGHIVQFNRSLRDMKTNPQSAPYQITSSLIKSEPRHGYGDNILYGVNKFSKPSVYELPSGLTRFFVAGHLTARRVFLSGSFNDWSTLKGLMIKNANGWVLDIKLQAGAYEYKFIADGNWMDDPDNLVTINDGAGNVNSVYYKYNYTFRLPGFASAHRIILAGSFNNWNASELFFEKKNNSWVLPVYLREGMYAYRFLVDDHWITDPTNAEKYTDDDGNVNSILNIGEAVNFNLDGYQNASSVYVAGDFNNWKPHAIKLKKSANGWDIALILPAGNYNYKFIADGQWILDPKNQNTNELDGQTNSFVAVKPNHKFKLKGYGNAKKIILSGTFNDWNHNGYTLSHAGDDWSINLNLKPGKYLYKFIVDGNWILDPGNKLWEQNQYNTGNSVLWMDINPD